MMHSICAYSHALEHLSLAFPGFHGPVSILFEIQIRVRGALTGFHCGSHSSLISLTETAFCDAVADPIKIAAGETFMVVKFSRCE